MLPTVLTPDGKMLKYHGRMPALTSKHSNPLKIYQSGPLLWVVLPDDVRRDLFRGIRGSNYDSKMRMHAISAMFLASVVRDLFNDKTVRDKYWPPSVETPGTDRIVDVLISQLVEAERARIGELQEDVPAYLHYNGTSPRSYQYEAARYLSSIGKAILALPLGSGKGCTVITALKLLREKPVPPFRGAVVICPSALKELVWRREVVKFSDMTPIVIEGTKAEREELYNTKADVYILNPELLHRDKKSIQRLVDQVSVLVVDEASVCKNDTSITTRTIRELADRKQFFWPMTGTPLMNSVMELYSLTSMVDSNIFRSKAEFQRRYMPQRNDGTWLVRSVQNVDELVEKIAPVMFARTPPELRDELPDTTTIIEPVELTSPQRKLYDEVRTQALVELSKYDAAPSEERYLVIRNVLSAITRMKQVCNGDFTENENPKIERLISLLEGDLINDKVLVFSQYETTALKIRDAVERAGYGTALLSGNVNAKDRQEAVDRYQSDPECKVFVMTTAGGMGLNLTKTTAVVYYDLLWNPQMMHQIAGRAVRIGNTSPHVNIITLLATGTIEDVIVKRLQEKSATFNAIMHDQEIAPDNTDGNAMFQELLDILKG